VVEVGYNPVIPECPPALKYTLKFLDKNRFESVMKKIVAMMGKV
jgi:hypothetical protein